MNNRITTALSLLGSFSLCAPIQAESLEQRVSELEQRISKLMQESSPTSSLSRPDTAGSLDDSFSGSSLNALAEKTTLGGYGELHLNINRGTDNVVDFHRWVLFLNHRFNDQIKLVSELELEHSLAGDGKPGEVELEQAYIEYESRNAMRARAGLFLIPVGFLNETHEPNTFFGVERNNVEKNIIPTTWWEAGIGVSKTLTNGLDVDWALHSGLNVSNDLESSNAFRLRSGRQKVASALANSWASTLRVRYTGITGLSLSGFVNYQSDLTQDSSEDNAALLYGATAAYQRGGFGLKALVAAWDIQGDSFEDNDADSQWGAFIEPSYTWTLSNSQRLGVFSRFSYYDYARGANNEKGGAYEEYSIGCNYWPIDSVVFKADYTRIENTDGGSHQDSLNFGVGYSF